MRDIKVVFTGQKRTASGTERTTFSAVPSKCTVTRAVCSAELQHQASSAALEFPYDPDLFKFLFTGGSGDPAAPGELSASITDGGKYVFTGRPSGKFTWNDLGIPCPAERLSLSLADDTDRLNIPAPKEMGWINEKIILILRDLAKLAKVAFPVKDPFTDPGQGYATLVIDEGKNIKSVLDAFLLQHGYSYYFDEMNDLRLFAIPGASAPSVADTLGEHDIVGSPSISQQDRDYTGVKVTYSTLTKKANEQVYFSGSGYKSDNTTAPAVVQQGVYYPFESAPAVEADEGQVYQTFETGYAETYRKYNGELDYRRSTRARLLYTENHRVMPEWDGDIEVERTEFGFRRASVRLVNNGDEDASVYCIAIRADAWYADTECTVTAGADGTPYTMECEHIHGASAAERLAKMLAKYFLAPCYKMTAQSEKELAVGSAVTFSTGLSGFTKDALVVSAQYDYDKELWTYTLVGYGGAAQLDIRRAKSQSSNVPALSEIAAVKQQVSKLPGADTTPPSIPVLVSLTGDDYGNALLVFSPSTDTGSGMSHYNIYRRRDGVSATLQVAGTVSHDPSAPQFLWEDMTAYKNAKYAYRVTAVDKAGNESAPSALAEFTSTVRIAPRPPEEPSAAASQFGIRIDWKPFQSSDAALRAAYHEVELSRDGGVTWAATGRSSERLDYWFDRETDGYPEKSDLAAWRIRVRAVSTYGNTSEYAECAVGTDGYLTWKIGALTATARAAEKVVTVAWTADGTFYGTPRFDLYKGAERLLDGVTAQTFRDYLAGYPEKDDLAGISYRLVARTEADSAELAGIAVDTSGYLTYKVTPPKAAVRADETGLRISWTGKTEPYYLYPVYDVFVAGEKVAEGITALSLDVPFPEDNRYPLRDDVAATGVVVAARTEADTAQSETAFPDMSAFKGWVPPVPTLYGTASGRTVPLSWNAPDVWGWTGCDVQVAKAYKVSGGKYEPITDESDLEWYAPALGKNPYESLDNYRHGDAGGWLSVEGTSVALTVPLWGQQKDESGNVMGAADTLYAYRVRGATVAYKSEWTDPFFAEARATGASDVVRAWNLNDKGEKVRIDGALGANQIFVEELAALSANLGLITDGGLFGGKYNYWAVNDTPMPDGSVLWKGSFRVGDADQYIKATPVLDGDGNPTGRIDLEFRAGQFTINATGTRIDGKSFEVYDDKGNLMFSVSPDEGAKVSVDTGTYVSGEYSFDQTRFIDTRYSPMQFAHGGGIVSVFNDFDYNAGDDDLPYKFAIKRTELAGGVKMNTVATVPGMLLSFNFIRVGEHMNTARFFGMLLSDGSAEYGLIDIDLSSGACSVHRLDDDTINQVSEMFTYDKTLFFNCDNVIFLAYKTGKGTATGTSGTYKIYLLDQAGLTELLTCDSECPNAPPVVEGDYVYLYVPYYRGSVIWRINRFSLAREAARLPFYDLTSNAGLVGYFGKKPDGFQVAANNIELFLSSSTTSRKKSGKYVVRIPSIGWQSIPEGGSPESIQFTKIEAYAVADYVPWIKGEQTNIGTMFLNGFSDDAHVWLLTSAQNYDDKLIRAEVQRLSLKLDGMTAFYGLSGKSSSKTEWKWEHQDDVFAVDITSDEAASIFYSVLYNFYIDSAVPFGGGFAIGWVDVHQETEGMRIQQKVYVPSFTEKTGKAVYGGGIGFVGVYKDEVSNIYRYYLDTGAYVDFREDGTLVASGEKGDKGDPGRDGADGATPAISVSATVDGGTGTPCVEVTKSGTQAAPAFALKFKNLKGEKGDTGALTVGNAVAADIADADYALGAKADGSVTKTLWSKVWAWVKGKIQADKFAKTTATANSEVWLDHKSTATSGDVFPARAQAATSTASTGGTDGTGSTGTDDKNMVSFGVGSGHDNKGLYVNDKGAQAWLIRSDNVGSAVVDMPNGLISNNGITIRKITTNVGGRKTVVLDASADVSSGVKLVIGAGGPTIIGGGESAAQIASGITTDTEVLHLTSDETVKIQTNIQNGVANAKTTTFNKDGSASFPGFIDITNAENSNSATPVKAIGGKMAANDAWRVAAGGTSNNGYLEIATDDDGTEEIRFAQYSGGGTGTFTNKVREAKILDANGDTVLPGTLFAGGYQQTRLFVIDTLSLPSSNFYPVTFPSSDMMLDCEIHSRTAVAADPYNQNVLHFQLISRGWSDTPFSFNVLQYGVYQESEITIGCVGIGKHNGMNAVWVRGGNTYRFICNRTPVLRTSGHTEVDETFTAGTFVDGNGLNANVGIVFDPRYVPYNEAYEVTGDAHAYFSGPVGILPYKDAGFGDAVLFGRGKPPRKMVDMGDAAYNALVSGAYIAIGSTNESGGIVVGGDGIDMWAPPDKELARFWNEDEGQPVAAVSGTGAYLGTAESSAFAQIREFNDWVYFEDFVHNVFRQITVPREINTDVVKINDVDYFPASKNIYGRSANTFSGLLGADFKCYVRDSIPGISGYGYFIVETSVVRSENDGDVYGMQIAYAITSASGRHSYKRCHNGEDGWSNWSSNDL